MVFRKRERDKSVEVSVIELERKTKLESKLKMEANQSHDSEGVKEGERILAPTRRPDGTLRKPVRIRAGYVPQDEVALYQSKGSLLKKETTSQVGPPGFDPDAIDSKPNTKSAKRNQRKKEKRIQAAIEKETNIESTVPLDSGHVSEFMSSLTSQINDLSVTSNSVEDSAQIGSTQDIDKRIRALKKKIRQTEALQQKTAEEGLKPEQLDKLAKVENWRKELKLLEDEKAETTAS